MRILFRSLLLAWIASTVRADSGAVPYAAPEGFRAADAPDDAGGRVVLVWRPMPYEGEGVSLEISVVPEGAPDVKPVVVTLPSARHFVRDAGDPFWARHGDPDDHQHEIDVAALFPPSADRTKGGAPGTYRFSLRARGPLGEGVAAEASASPAGNWFNRKKLNNLVYVVLFGTTILWFISHARKRDLFLRRIPGIDAVEEAIGRATEMGRPLFYLTGRSSASEPMRVSTIAAMTILGEVSRRVADYDSQLKVPHTDPVVMGICQEITRQAYTQAGRPDAYRTESNFFVTEDQFSYTAAVDGMMIREKPAACFYMGYYYAESLLLAETGASTGAIQIAGTDAEAQMPFFITACDYTLIGEELYATSAYLSKEPVQVGTLRGQDASKAIFIVLLGVSVALLTAFSLAGDGIAMRPFLDLFRSF